MKLSRLIAGLALALVAACSSDKVTGPPVAASVTVTPGSAVTSALGLTQQFSAAAADASGAPVTGATVTWASSNPAVATINASGLATATGPGTATITATVQGVDGTSAFTVNQVPTQLVVAIQPTNAAAGQAFSPAVQVEVRDANGARVVLSRDAVTLTLGANPGSGTLGGAKTVNAVDGVATFSGLSLDKAGTGYTLAAASGSLTGATSSTFNISPGAASRLAVTAQPSSGQGGAVIAPAVQVTVQDAFGNTVPNATTAVTIALGSNPGGATLGGTATQNAVNGVATFADLVVRGGGNDYTLVASAPGLASAATAAFNMAPIPAVASFSPAAGVVTTGTGTTLTPVFSGGTATVDHGIGTVTSGTPVPTGNLSATTAFTLTVTNTLGATSTQLTTVSVVAAPSVTSLTAAQTTVTGGTATTLTPTFSGGTGTIDNGIGPVTSGASISTGALAATTTFTLTVTNAAGTSVTSSVGVAVVSTPVITGFVTAAGSNTITITSGTSTNLTAIFGGGTGTIDHGVGTVTSGVAASTGALTATTTFSLTVANAAGTSTSALVTVIVVQAPSIASLTAAQSTITSGTGTTLTPTFSGGTGTIDHGIGAVISGTAIPTGALTAATTYTLTVTNAAGSSATATVAIAVATAPSIASFGATQATITSGTSTTLAAVFSGGTATVDHSLGAVISGGSVSTGTLTAATTYTLTVTNAAGASVTATTSVAVVAAPTITSFTAAQGTVTGGTGTILTAVFSGGTAAIDHGVGAVTSGVTASTGNLSASTTFTLTVTNAAGSSVTASASVAVVGSPTITGFLAATGTNVVTITSGTSTSLTAVFAGGTGSIDHGVGAVTSGVPVSTGNLTATTSYSLTVANGAGTVTTALVTVIVVPAPSITSFAATASTITSGTNATLTPVFSGGTGTIDNGVGQVTSGVAVSPGATTTGATNYTLTVTNAAGTSVTSSVTITVVAAPVITSLTAAQSIVTVGSGTNVTAFFSGGNALLFASGGPVPVTSGVPVSTGGINSIGDARFLLTVTNAAGTSVTAEVQVSAVAAPSISSFSILGPPVVTTGTTVFLAANFSGGTAVVDHGVGAIVPTGGLPLQNLADGSTLFTLTVTNAAGTSVTAFASITVVAAPTITSFTAAQGSVTTGTSTMLTAVFSGGLAAVDHSVGGVASGVAVSSGVLSGLTMFTLTVTNAAGTSVTATTIVAAVDPPTITGFNVVQPFIASGTSTNLLPTFFGGTGTIDHGVGAVTSGGAFPTGNLTQAGTTTFTLTVTNAAGSSVTAAVPVNVVAAPSIASFVATNPTVTTGTGTFLTPTFSGGNGTINGTPVASGSPFPTGNLFGPSLFVLTVTNSLGASVSVGLTVNAVDPPSISSFSTSPLTVTSGNTTTLSPVFSGGTGVVDHGVGTVASGIQAVTGGLVVGTTTFTLTVTNAAGTSVTATASVTAIPAPSISAIAATPALITSGSISFLNLLFSGGTALIDHGIGAVSNNQPVPTGPLSATTTFTARVTNPLGAFTTDTVTVTVVPPPVISSFVTSAGSVTPFNNVNLTPTFTGGTGVLSRNGVSFAIVNSGQMVPVSLFDAAATFTLTVTNAAGTSVAQSVTVEVSDATIQTFTATPDTLVGAGNTTLNVAFTNGTGVIDQGIGVVSSPVSGLLFVPATTTYTLTVTDLQGRPVTRKVTVVVQ